MHTRLKLLGIILLTFFAFSCFLTLNSVVGQTNSADSKVQAANDAVNKAFNDVSAAEKAGANVTSLLNQLNGAEDLLAQAEMDYRNGDSVSAESNADSVVPIAQQVSSAAHASESTALTDGRNAFWLTIVFSSVGCVVFVLALFLVWRKAKKNYVRTISDAEPEVTRQ